MYSKIATISTLVAAARAQNFCTQTAETHPPLSWQRCSAGGSCSSVSGSVVIDANWRWSHSVSSTTNCYNGNTWDNTLCPNNQACTTNCCIDGADYSSTYGVTTSGNSLNLKFVTNGPYTKNIGSRLYLMASDTKYQMFTLLGNEFTFDVDVSNIGCGLNGALYFVNMDEDGGMARFSTNKAGAKYGTGYCDSQCPSDVKYINGQANREGWVPSSNDANAGTGGLGACCGEMDIWEANKISTAYTPHPCLNPNYHSCVGDACGGTYSDSRYAGDCDPDGCDFNSWRQGNRTFYGPGSGFTVDTNQKVTVVTQFLTGSNGALSEIKRFYVQNGKVIPNSQSTIAGVSGNSITADYCSAQKSVFGDVNSFADKGGMSGSSSMLAKPMVLVMSLWDDHYANMLWLDSTYPVTSTKPGASRGSCAITSGVPADVESQVPNSNVIFSNIKFGPIGSTFNQNGGGTTNPPTTTTSARPGTTSPPSGTVPQYGQCGGNGWTGGTQCVSPFVCTKINDWYSQCI